MKNFVKTHLVEIAIVVMGLDCIISLITIIIKLTKLF